MYNSADDAPVVGSLNTSYVRRQTWFDPLPLLIAQPEQVLAHAPDPPNESGSYGIRIAFSQQKN